MTKTYIVREFRFRFPPTYSNTRERLRVTTQPANFVNHVHCTYIRIDRICLVANKNNVY